MKLQKFRWSKVYESQEEELAAFLAARDITAERCVLEEFARPDEQPISQDSTIWCAEGSAKFSVSGTTFSIQAGDGLHLPTGATLQIYAGMSGCVWYQAAAAASPIN